MSVSDEKKAALFSSVFLKYSPCHFSVSSIIWLKEPVSRVPGFSVIQVQVLPIFSVRESAIPLFSLITSANYLVFFHWRKNFCLYAMIKNAKASFGAGSYIRKIVSAKRRPEIK